MSDSSASRAATLLGMFAKHWEPGKVKTRLAATLGESHAAMFHALCVATLADRLASVGDRRVLAFAPAQAEQAFRCVARDRWEVVPQSEGDLGSRMQAFFATALAGAERVVLIGSDSPDLPREYIAGAFDALETRDVVLGPAGDGGYYLLGAARRVPPLFDGIAWSSPQVWPQTIARLEAAGIAWHELPPWHDVDDEAGLTDLASRLATGAATRPATMPRWPPSRPRSATLQRNCLARRSKAG